MSTSENTGAELGPFERFATLALLLVPFLNARNGKWILALGQRVLDLLKSLMKKVGEWITWYGQAVSNDLKALWSKLEEVSQSVEEAVVELFRGPQLAYATGSGGGPRPNPGGGGRNPPRGGGPTKAPPTSSFTSQADNIADHAKSHWPGKTAHQIKEIINDVLTGWKKKFTTPDGTQTFYIKDDIALVIDKRFCPPTGGGTIFKPENGASAWFKKKNIELGGTIEAR